MKDLAVAVLALLLGALGPQRYQHSPFDPLWELGLLALMAFAGERAARALRLPALVGWIGAGLLLGPEGLRAVGPADSPVLQAVQAMAGAWVGFQTGLYFSWPGRFEWKKPGLMALATLLTFVLATAGIALVVQPPAWVALLCGALFSLWGPCTGWPARERRGALQLAVLGTAASFLLLSGVLWILALQDGEASGAAQWVGRLWLSLAAGAGSLLGLRLLGLFAASSSTVAASLFATFASAGLVLPSLHLYALPFGLAAGLQASRHLESSRRLRHLVGRGAPMAFMIFFALLGATIPLRVLWPPADGAYQIALLATGVVVVVRGLAFAIFPALQSLAQGSGRTLGWLLLPRGALLCEWVYHPQASLLELLDSQAGPLVHQVLLVDILVGTLVFSVLADLALFLARRPTRPANQEETSGAAIVRL